MKIWNWLKFDWMSLKYIPILLVTAKCVFDWEISYGHNKIDWSKILWSLLLLCLGIPLQLFSTLSRPILSANFHF